MLELTAEAKFELQFWIESLVDDNAQPIWHSPSAVRVAYSDVSNTGYGGYTVEHGILHRVTGLQRRPRRAQSGGS